MFEKSRILVAGGTGFLGNALIDRLLREGARVRATHHSRRPNAATDSVEWLEADLRRPDACAAAVRDVDIVLMCAADTAGAAVMVERPLVQVTPNVVMNAYMLEAAHAAGAKRFLFISSGAAYPDVGDRLLREEDMDAGDPPDVYFAVGWMKRYTEILCRTYATKIRNPLPCTVIRPSNVYGPGDKFDFARSHVTAAQIRRVIERHDPIQVWGTGNDVRDLIFIDDFIEGVMRALRCEQPHLVLNIASGIGHTVREIVETAIRVDGYDNARVEYDPTKPQTIGKRILDPSRAARLLDFRAGTPLAAGFQKTMAWYRDRHKANTA